ncbi:MAG: hypothetical protein Q4B22_11105 [Eubacteriales bacterium]|nr:hypothetical protein [Eubacteriales bacterium]
MNGEWYELDNAAKIMPSSVIGVDTRVFRLVCELKEEIDPEILQHALDRAMEEYPYMNCCIRKGIFWYYMDQLPGSGLVKEEKVPALKALYIPGKKNLLYRVNYFEKRINFEVFHALADGTGGMIIFADIITNYLAEKYDLDRSQIKSSSASVEERLEDAFSRYYEKHERRKRNYLKEMFPVKAYQLKGVRDENKQERLIEGTVSVRELLDTAHRFGVTVGVFATSVWIEAIIKQMKRSEYRKPIVVSVPVNLRQFFPSETTRNFFGTFLVSYDAHLYDGTLESIFPVVEKAFKEELKPDKIKKTMNSYASLEHNVGLKLVPLIAKYFSVMGIITMMRRGITTSVSNVGRLPLAKTLSPFVEKISVFMANMNIFMCIITYEDKMVFGIVSCFSRHPVEMNFFRRLRELGIAVEIGSNDYDREVE